MKPKIIFSDFDGTITMGTELGPLVFDLFELCNEMEVPLVIVSGRSVSWGHFLLTHFPISKCIMEGGGVIVRKSKLGIITEEILVSQKNLEDLNNTTKDLKKKFPDIMAIDSFGRKTDRAVDLALIDIDQNKKIKKFLKERQSHFSQSSVHINYWHGEVSKFNAIESLLQSDFKGIRADDCIFFGDAPNDESVFKSMKHTVGVSNIMHFLDEIKHRPEIILAGESNTSIHGVINFLKSLK